MPIPGFGLLTKVMSYIDQRCLGLFLLEQRRQRESVLRRPNNEGHSQKEIIDFFRIQTQSSDRLDSQQAPDFTGNTRGVSMNKATKLGRSRHPQKQKLSKYWWMIHQKVQAILAQCRRKPMRVLLAKDVKKLRYQPMLGLLGPCVQDSNLCLQIQSVFLSFR